MNIPDLAERSLLPDWIIRWGIRRLLASRLRLEERRNKEEPRAYVRQFIEELRGSPIAVATESQRAALRSAYLFFQQVLGPRLKYSAIGLLRNDSGRGRRRHAIAAALRFRTDDILVGLRMGLASACGLPKIPACRILAISTRAHNGNTSGALQNRAGAMYAPRRRTYGNSKLTALRQVLSVEMLEHVRNYERCSAESSTVKADGKMAVHIFIRALPIHGNRGFQLMGSRFTGASCLPMISY